MTENDALTAWRAAIAATDAAGAVPITEEGYEAFAVAAFSERMAGRRYLAARDASVAAQVTRSEAGPGVADFVGDANATS